MTSKFNPNLDVDLQACTRGDKRAWDAFVTRWSGLIYAAVRHVIYKSDPFAGDSGTSGSGGISGSRGISVGGGVEVDDATQEVFVRLVKDEFRLLKSFDPSRATLSTWLTIVSRSVAIDCMRRKRLLTTPLEPHHAPMNASQESICSTGSAEDAVPATAAARLPMHLLTERQRLVLHMLFDEGLSVPQTARRMGVDDQTIRSTKHKALTRLRQHFGVDSKT